MLVMFKPKSYFVNSVLFILGITYSIQVLILQLSTTLFYNSLTNNPPLKGIKFSIVLFLHSNL